MRDKRTPKDVCGEANGTGYSFKEYCEQSCVSGTRENEGRERKESSLFPLPLALVFSLDQLVLLATQNREL